mmetsp:Transcript_41411/g.71782  ORF Transcript_41411/g.71782 Transcript_41411/m.71782 type:complete len:212 (+) Transcript_41411:449-1084(+)
MSFNRSSYWFRTSTCSLRSMLISALARSITSRIFRSATSFSRRMLLSWARSSWSRSSTKFSSRRWRSRRSTPITFSIDAICPEASTNCCRISAMFFCKSDFSESNCAVNTRVASACSRLNASNASACCRLERESSSDSAWRWASSADTRAASRATAMRCVYSTVVPSTSRLRRSTSAVCAAVRVATWDSAEDFSSRRRRSTSWRCDSSMVR